MRCLVVRTLILILLTSLGLLEPRTAAASEARASQVETRQVTGYRKGRPLAVELVTVDWVELERRTARAFEKMQRAAARDGIELAIRSGFRSHERQIALYRAWRAGWGNRAARPGHSNHQNGRAVDLVIVEAETFTWLQEHAGRFGFLKTVRDEPWHWEYLPGAKSAKSAKSAKRAKQARRAKQAKRRR